MKKALFALGLLAVAILPGCGGDNDGCKGCSRDEVRVQAYNKTAGHMEQGDLPEGEDIHLDEDEYL